MSRLSLLILQCPHCQQLPHCPRSKAIHYKQSCLCKHLRTLVPSSHHRGLWHWKRTHLAVASRTQQLRMDGTRWHDGTLMSGSWDLVDSCDTDLAARTTWKKWKPVRHMTNTYYNWLMVSYGSSVLAFAWDGCTLATLVGTCQVASIKKLVLTIGCVKHGGSLGHVRGAKMWNVSWSGLVFLKRALSIVFLKSGNPSSNDGICGLACSLKTCNESSTHTSQDKNSPPNSSILSFHQHFTITELHVEKQWKTWNDIKILSCRMPVKVAKCWAAFS